MDSAQRQKLHDDMQAAFARSNIATSAANCFPEGFNFSKMFFSSTVFKGLLEKQQKAAYDDLDLARKAKEQVIKEMEKTFQILTEEAKNAPALSPYLEKFLDLKTKCPPMSFELAHDMHEILRKVCNLLQFLKKQTHSKKYPFLNDPNLPSKCEHILKILVKLDNKGTITEHIFAPSWQEFQKELAILERTQKTSLCNSIHVLSQVQALYELRNRENRYHHFIANNHHSAAELFKSDYDQFDAVLEASKFKFHIDIEKYKIHLHRVWIAAKPLLIPNNPDIFYYDYSAANDLRKGILSKGGKKHEFTGNSAALLHLVVRCRQVSKDEASEELNLPGDSIRSARRTIMKNVKKTLEFPIILPQKALYQSTRLLN